MREDGSLEEGEGGRRASEREGEGQRRRTARHARHAMFLPSLLHWFVGIRAPPPLKPVPN